MKSAGREGGQMGDAPRGREPRRRALSQELPRESGLGTYKFLVPIKKDSRPQVLWRGSIPNTWRTESFFAHRLLQAVCKLLDEHAQLLAAGPGGEGG